MGMNRSDTTIQPTVPVILKKTMNHALVEFEPWNYEFRKLQPPDGLGPRTRPTRTTVRQGLVLGVPNLWITPPLVVLAPNMRAEVAPIPRCWIHVEPEGIHVFPWNTWPFYLCIPYSLHVFPRIFHVFPRIRSSRRTIWNSWNTYSASRLPYPSAASTRPRYVAQTNP